MTNQLTHYAIARLLPAIVALILALPASTMAHAFLDHAEPKVGSEVDKAPAEVRIRFTQHVEPAFSGIEVFDSNGNKVDKKDTHPDAQDPSVLIVSVGQLSPGTYKVAWHVVSVDTHRTKGDFKFTVK
jgi:methionine-rich copper-binding protein CopC